MNKDEIVELDELAKSLVAGRPIESTVTFDARSGNLTVSFKSSDDPANGRKGQALSESPRASSDRAINEQSVRDWAERFLSRTGL